MSAGNWIILMLAGLLLPFMLQAGCHCGQVFGPGIGLKLLELL